jgi:hypothetical protein
MTEKQSYSPGDVVDISYMLMDQMKAPIAQGKVNVQIFYNDPSDGEQIIDEFYAASDVNMMEGDLLKQRTTWNVPKTAKEGKYTVKTYFIVGDFFNLAGISVLAYGPPGVPGELTSFEVKNPGESSAIYYLKNATTVNGQEYLFASPTQVYDTGNLVIKTKLVNNGPAKTVTVKMNAYEWADLTGKAIQENSVEKTINLQATGAEDITYDISNLPPAAYEIRLSAESGDEKSLMKLRLPVTGVKGRFIYLGLDKFPLAKDTDTKAFACYSQSADYGTAFNGTIKIEILDEQGNQIYQEESGTLRISSTPPQGKVSSFMPAKDTSVLTLKATMYDENKILQDTISIRYDYSKFASSKGKLSIEIDKKTYQPGDELAYMVSYTDKNGAPLNGKILAYLTGPKGKIIATVPDNVISGQYKGKFTLPNKEGTYTITVRETQKDLEADASIITGATGPEITTTIPEEIVPVTTYPEPKKTDQLDYLPIIGAAAVLLIMIVILTRRKK